MSDNSSPHCRFCVKVAMQATSLPANRDSIRGIACLLVALGLGIGTVGRHLILNLPTDYCMDTLGAESGSGALAQTPA